MSCIPSGSSRTRAGILPSFRIRVRIRGISCGSLLKNFQHFQYILLLIFSYCFLVFIFSVCLRINILLKLEINLATIPKMDIVNYPSSVLVDKTKTYGHVDEKIRKSFTKQFYTHNSV